MIIGVHRSHGEGDNMGTEVTQRSHREGDNRGKEVIRGG